MENWPLILNTPGYFLFVQMEGKGNEITKTNNKSSYQSLGRNKTREEIIILIYLSMYISPITAPIAARLLALRFYVTI